MSFLGKLIARLVSTGELSPQQLEDAMECAQTDWIAPPGIGDHGEYQAEKIRHLDRIGGGVDEFEVGRRELDAHEQTALNVISALIPGLSFAESMPLVGAFLVLVKARGYWPEIEKGGLLWRWGVDTAEADCDANGA